MAQRGVPGIIGGGADVAGTNLETPNVNRPLKPSRVTRLEKQSIESKMDGVSSWICHFAEAARPKFACFWCKNDRKTFLRGK